MKAKLIYVLALTLILFGCTKEVVIDIPGYEEVMVIDGRIETGQPPIVLLSSSSEVYSPTDLQSFLNSYISGATVTVSNGTSTVVLDEICSDNLPPGTEELAANMLGIPVDQLSLYNICAYTTLDPSVWGEVGKTYTLNVSYDGKSYSGETRIVAPTALVNTFWQAEEDSLYGYSWATLADPANQYDAYFWEANMIGRLNGSVNETGFSPTYSPVFDDEFFDGLTFDFWYENPHMALVGAPDDYKWYYDYGDTVVIKLSKIEPVVYEFFEKKYVQLQTAGNPFATPTNIPNNLSNGALGVWAGFSPSFDTLICVP